MTDRPCGCTAPSEITDPELHDRWHALVIVQGGPAGRCDAETLRAARGMDGGTPNTTRFDVRVEKLGQRASGARRRAAANDG